MISTARVPADKPVRIAFSLDNAAGMLCSEEKLSPTTTPPAGFLPSSFPRSVFKNACLGSSLAVQWLGLCTLCAGATGSILGQGTKILHAVWPKKEHAWYDPVMGNVIFFFTPCWSVTSRNPSGDVSTSKPWVVRAHFFFTFSVFAFAYYKIHGATTISKESKLCHCSNCMGKCVLRAGTWLGKIKISLSWFQQHFLKPSS